MAQVRDSEWVGKVLNGGRGGGQFTCPDSLLPGDLALRP